MFSVLVEIQREYKNGNIGWKTVQEDGMEFWQYYNYGSQTYTFIAGSLCKDEYENYFIPMTVQDCQVTELGAGSVSSARSISQKTGKLELLKKLYFPGSAVAGENNYFLGTSDLEIFYCSSAIRFFWGRDEVKAVYCPEEIYEDFCAEQLPNFIAALPLYKANISYRLSAEELPEYYYADSVEYGQGIVNIPPEPQRKGYAFGGWYTEPTYEHEWDFSEDIVPLLSEGEEFKELNLYAKWVKA